MPVKVYFDDKNDIPKRFKKCFYCQRDIPAGKSVLTVYVNNERVAVCDEKCYKKLVKQCLKTEEVCS